MLERDKKIGALMMLLSAVLFSFKPIFTKLAYKYSVPSDVLLAMRMLIAIPLFWIVFFVTSDGKKYTHTKKEYIFFILAGFLGFFAAAECGFLSLKYIDASVSTMIIYTYPAIV
ncbi:EamA family transporter, partial [Thermodesulfobacteriota bacterium]